MDNTQYGPPGCADLLADVLTHITYKPGWNITLGHMRREYEHLAGGEGLTLRIEFKHEDSTTPVDDYGNGRKVGLDHYFAVPPAAYNRETWERWVLDCLIQMETHEAMEYFKVDGRAPFFPAHGVANGFSPYTVARRSPGDDLPGAPAWPAEEEQEARKDAEWLENLAKHEEDE